MSKIFFTIWLLIASTVTFAAQWQFLATRDFETVIYFSDVDRKIGSHTLL